MKIFHFVKKSEYLSLQKNVLKKKYKQQLLEKILRVRIIFQRKYYLTKESAFLSYDMKKIGKF